MLVFLSFLMRSNAGICARLRRCTYSRKTNIRFRILHRKCKSYLLRSGIARTRRRWPKTLNLRSGFCGYPCRYYDYNVACVTALPHRHGLGVMPEPVNCLFANSAAHYLVLPMSCISSIVSPQMQPPGAAPQVSQSLTNTIFGTVRIKSVAFSNT